MTRSREQKAQAASAENTATGPGVKRNGSSANGSANKCARERVTAIAWIEEPDWNTLRDSMADSDSLPQEYTAWLARTERQLELLDSRGFKVHKVRLQPDEFDRWCLSHGMRRDAGARAIYVSKQLQLIVSPRSDVDTSH